MTDADDFLAHYGKKGMKWGVRKDVKAGREQARKSSAKAGEIIREARRAETPAQRKAAADRYKKEILDEFKTPEWKKSFKDANSVTRGSMVVTTLTLGPLGYVQARTLNNPDRLERAYQQELDTAHEILREMRRR